MSKCYACEKACKRSWCPYTEDNKRFGANGMNGIGEFILDLIKPAGESMSEEKQKEYPKIELRTKDPSRLTTGANAELLINGEVQKNVKSFKLEVEAGGMAKATVEYYGAFTCNVVGQLEQEYIRIDGNNTEAKND